MRVRVKQHIRSPFPWTPFEFPLACYQQAGSGTLAERYGERIRCFIPPLKMQTLKSKQSNSDRISNTSLHLYLMHGSNKLECYTLDQEGYLGLFVSYEENEVLWIRPLIFLPRQSYFALWTEPHNPNTRERIIPLLNRLSKIFPKVLSLPLWYGWGCLT